MSVAASRGVHPTCRPAERAQQVRTQSGQGPRTQRNQQCLPSLADVHSTKSPTLRHVPRASRGLWAQALIRCLAAVAAFVTYRLIRKRLYTNAVGGQDVRVITA